MTTIPIISENPADKILDAVIEEYLNPEYPYPWIVTFSGGKDSTLVAHLVFSALLELSPSQRKRKIYFVSNDTLVESPLVVRHMKNTLQKILAAVNSVHSRHLIPLTRATPTNKKLLPIC